ncbi:ABC transporter permease [Egibacter rhizosphaerae]|uniref:ABC transporter permease n=1 Tax=Egibacter rhizosphaerae TaxID=1670831 RepID=A0A411YCC8_9ACTN|nr:ABC transporter permease [Egibacter rhizosphaerae]QBI18812.1 ABC transporter permease [Egibacter rhizosphaerae]
MTVLRAVLAAHRRNLRLARRDPTLLLQAAVVPLVVLGLCAVIFGGGGDDWPVAVTDHADTERSRALVAAIEDSRSGISPYFDIVQTNPQRAAEQLDEGRLQLHVEIPADFDATRAIDVATYNINSDAMKNARLRLTNALNAYDADTGQLPVVVDLDRTAPADVPRTAFIAGSAVLLALAFGAALLAANLFAVDAEARTSKEIVLSPLGPAWAGVAAALSGITLAPLSALPTLLAATTAFGLSPAPDDAVRAGALLPPILLAAAGTGVAVAGLLRRHRALQPVIILAGIASFFAAGGLVGVADLPPAARAFAAVWPPSRVFEWLNPVMHGFTAPIPPTQWAAGGAAAVAGLALASLTGQRERALFTRPRR